MTDVRVLDVLLHGEAVGTLVNSGERTYFSLNDAYVEDRDRPVVSAGFTDEFGGLVTEFPDTRTRVMPFFSNMLPEGHLREYLAGRAKVSPVREFFLLWALGDDLPGAVTIRSATGEVRPSGDGDDVETRRHGENALRFSLAGVQLKFSAIMGIGGRSHDSRRRRRGIVDSKAAFAQIPEPAGERIFDDDPGANYRSERAGSKTRRHWRD